MKRHIYGAGVVALALAMSGVPAIALAQNGNGEGQGGAMMGAQVKAQVTEQEQVEGAPMGVSARVGGQGADDSVGRAGEPVQNENQEMHQNQVAERMQGGKMFALEGTTTPAFSLAQLKQSIEMRRQELDQEEASSSVATRGIMKDANPVRLAVHALLASRDLLGGGIGQQVSAIAQEMNDSVATTTSAEAQIQSRGFFSRLFFGGDTTAADVIAQQVAKNQQRIEDLTALLGQADISADVKTELQVIEYIISSYCCQARIRPAI